MSAQPFMWPFSLFAPGNLNQPILPGWSFGNVSVSYAGNAGIEIPGRGNGPSFFERVVGIVEIE